MRLRNSFTTALVLLAFSPAPGVAQEEVGLFSVDLGLSIWTIVVFLLLLWVLGRFAWGPILRGLDVRERAIQDSIDEANRLREEAEGLLEQHRAQVAMARKEAQEIVTQAREAGDRLRREMEEKARQEGDRIIERARREIGLERDKAVEELRRESVDLALAAATKLLRRKLDTEENRKLVVDVLDELPAREAEA